MMMWIPCFLYHTGANANANANANAKGDVVTPTENQNAGSKTHPTRNLSNIQSLRVDNARKQVLRSTVPIEEKKAEPLKDSLVWDQATALKRFAGQLGCAADAVGWPRGNDEGDQTSRLQAFIEDVYQFGKRLTDEQTAGPEAGPEDDFDEFDGLSLDARENIYERDFGDKRVRLKIETMNGDVNVRLVVLYHVLSKSLNQKIAEAAGEPQHKIAELAQSANMDIDKYIAQIANEGFRDKNLLDTPHILKVSHRLSGATGTLILRSDDTGEIIGGVYFKPDELSENSKEKLQIADLLDRVKWQPLLSENYARRTQSVVEEVARGKLVSETERTGCFGEKWQENVYQANIAGKRIHLKILVDSQDKIADASVWHTVGDEVRQQLEQATDPGRKKLCEMAGKLGMDPVAYLEDVLNKTEGGSWTRPIRTRGIWQLKTRFHGTQHELVLHMNDVGAVKGIYPCEITSPQLDEEFGELDLPAYIRASENDSEGLVIQHPTVQKLGPADQLTIVDWDALKGGTKKYMWLIDAGGFLNVAEEIVVGWDHEKNEVACLGHGTLLRGGSARIAGNIGYDEDKDCFYIDDCSGRYCVQITRTEPQLKNVLALFHQAQAHQVQSYKRFLDVS